jgi:hypothetical protein
MPVLGDHYELAKARLDVPHLTLSNAIDRLRRPARRLRVAASSDGVTCQ